MTTIGRESAAKIVAVCDDGTVHIYDSVTGVLRLSLRPEFPILEITGPPDGSLLVCTHKWHSFITLWDIQTGGLVHTFILKQVAKHTAVSLNGRYLACDTYEHTVSVWETASRTQNPAPLGNFLGNASCWMVPEEFIMVASGESVHIRNVITKGPPVHKFDIPYSAHSLVYSQIFDRLVIVHPYWPGRNSFTILDVKTGTSSTLHRSGKRLSSVALSQIIEQLVRGGGRPGLETVDISTGCRTRFDFPGTVTSVSMLSNGTMVANVQGSGIQLLSLNQENTSPRQPAPPSRTVHPVGKGTAIAVVPVTDDRVILLETATMSQVLSIPDHSVATDHAVVLDVSLEHKVAVGYFQEGDKGYLQMWEFSHHHPRWIVSTGELPSLGRISPACTRLVTFHDRLLQGDVRVWDVYGGGLLVSMVTDRYLTPCPLKITFDSEDRFYFHHNTHREPYVINAAPLFRDLSSTYSITRCAKQELEGQVWEKYYCLDDGREWVLCGSQRIFRIPLGYIASDPASHCWAGSSLVMVGQDGTLRKLTFVESSL